MSNETVFFWLLYLAIVTVIVCFIWAYYMFRRDRNVKENGIETTAEVLWYTEEEWPGNWSDSSSVKRMVLKFKDEKGIEHIIVQRRETCGIYLRNELGSIIDIRYIEKENDYKIGKDYKAGDRIKISDEESIIVTDSNAKFDIVFCSERHLSDEQKAVRKFMIFVAIATAIGIPLLFFYS